MEFKIGQKVRIKPDSPFARFTGGDVLTIKLVNPSGERYVSAPAPEAPTG